MSDEFSIDIDKALENAKNNDLASTADKKPRLASETFGENH